MILVKNRLGKFYEQIPWEIFTNVWEIFTNVREIFTNVWQIFTKDLTIRVKEATNSVGVLEKFRSRKMFCPKFQ